MNEPHDPPFAPRSWPVFLVSGLCGIVLGATGYATWQDCVEGGQVVAGVVQYPSPTPVYVYLTKLWNVSHHACALLLWAGVSETSVCLIVSGILGMLSFQALAGVVFCLSREPVLSVLAPFIILQSHGAEYEITYAVFLMGQPVTYGILGLSFCLLTLVLLSLGKRVGSFLLGIAPYAHLTLGFLIWFVILLCALTNRRSGNEAVRTHRHWLLAGLLVCLTALVLHQTFIYDVPARSPGSERLYLMSFIHRWDMHRGGFPVTRLKLASLAVVAASATLAGILLFRMRSSLPTSAIFLLRGLLASALLGALFFAGSFAPSSALPDEFVIAMPQRILSLPLLAAMAVIIGAMGLLRPHVVVQSSLLAFLLIASISGRAVVALVTVLGTVWVALLPRLASKVPMVPRAGEILNRSIRLLGAGLVVLMIVRAVVSERGDLYPAKDWKRDAVLAATAGRTGLLLTCSDLRAVQLRTRRPVLLDGGSLDMLPYTLEVASNMDHILRVVYGVDLLTSDEILQGALRPDQGREVWERRTESEWQGVRREFGVADVLAYPDWALSLPLVARNERWALYRIP